MKSLNRRYNKYKSSAKERNHEFYLTKYEFETLIISNCAYCGKQGGGIDRIDSKIGYLLGNCLPCCKRCNNKKNCMLLIRYIVWWREGKVSTKNNRLVRCLTSYILSS